LEALEYLSVPLVRLAEIASLLGLELSATLHPVGDPIRDNGHQVLGARFREAVSSAWTVVAELPLPGPSELRSWDLVLRLARRQVVGVELETRIRDIQALVRKMRARERDGGVDELLLVLADTRVNRRLVDELCEALGDRYATSPRRMLTALRAGEPVPGSGLLLL
jgi:hypothetical protein